MNILDEKKALRQEMFGKRRGLDPSFKKEYDAWICEQLEKIIHEGNYRVIHAYIPILTEIDIQPLLEKLLRSGRTVICPKTLPKRKLENRILSSLDDLEVGIMGTKHPASSSVYEQSPDLIIVPGLAFDSSKKRLGYGGGYYDNYLVDHPSSIKVGIFYPFQEVAAVPIEAHDLSLDLILVKELLL